jgi:UDP-glucose 4-epimerase
MKVLVTGGAGFVGSHLVDALVEQQHEVTVVDVLGEGSIKYIHPEAKFYEIDIRSEALDQVFQKHQPEIVFHLAAQSTVPPSIKNPMYDQSVNIGGTIQVLEMMRKYNGKKIIYSSSAAVYGEPVSLPIQEEHPIKPLSPYGLSKYVAEQYIELYNRMYGIDYTTFRYANIYGPRQTPEGEGGVVSIFVDKVLKGETPTINGDGRHTRDYIFVKDVVAANIAAMDKGSQSVVNISTGNAVSVSELLELIGQAVEKEVNPIYGPERAGDIVHSTLDPGKAHEALNWKAVNQLLDGLKKTISS